MTGVCMHPRCTLTVRGHELACRAHWHDLEVSLRNRIWRTWKHRDTNPVAHTRAVGDAARVWMAAVRAVERAHRCANCKAEALGTDEAGSPLCLVCARAALHPLTGTATLRCADCGQPSDILVTIDEPEPTRCLNCQIRELAYA